MNDPVIVDADPTANNGPTAQMLVVAPVVVESAKLSIAERGRELSRLFGFNQSILARRANLETLRVYCRDFYAYLEYAASLTRTDPRLKDADPVELALLPSTLARWLTSLSDKDTVSPETGRHYSPNTINRMGTAVRRIMKEAGAQGFIAPERVHGFGEVEGASRRALKDRLRPHNRVRISQEQMRTITDLAEAENDRLVGLRNWALLLALASCGLRVDAFRTLRTDQLVKREDGYKFHVMSKNETEPRDVPLSPEAYAAIQEWLCARPADSAYIFTRFEGRGEGEHTRSSPEPLSAFSVRTIVKQAAALAGVPYVKTHDFRRFVGTVVARLYGVKMAQEVLGHRDAATTLNNYVLPELQAGVTDHLF